MAIPVVMPMWIGKIHAHGTGAVGNHLLVGEE